MDIRVTQNFLDNEGYLEVRSSRRLTLQTLPLTFLLGVNVGALIGMVIGVVNGAIFYGDANAVFGLSALVGGIVAAPITLWMLNSYPECRRLRAVHASTFGTTLDRLYYHYRRISNRYGLSGQEIKDMQQKLDKMMDEVWREAHRVLGLTFEEAPSLKSAEELLQELSHIKKAIDELDQGKLLQNN